MQFIAIVQKLVMSAFPHLGSGARQGVVSSRYLGMLISTQYTLDTHMCCVAGWWLGWWRHSYSCQESFTTATATGHLAPAQLASSRLQTPARRLHWAQLSGSVYTFISYHTFITLPLLSVFSALSIPLFVCSGNAGNSVLTSTKKYI